LLLLLKDKGEKVEEGIKGERRERKREGTKGKGGRMEEGDGAEKMNN